jgi:hypothetical protein
MGTCLLGLLKGLVLGQTQLIITYECNLVTSLHPCKQTSRETVHPSSGLGCSYIYWAWGTTSSFKREYVITQTHTYNSQKNHKLNFKERIGTIIIITEYNFEETSENVSP